MTEREKQLQEENIQLKMQIEILMKEIIELKARLGMNSTNSSMPPSSDKVSKKKIKLSLSVRKVTNLLADNLDIREQLWRK